MLRDWYSVCWSPSSGPRCGVTFLWGCLESRDQLIWFSDKYKHQRAFGPGLPCPGREMCGVLRAESPSPCATCTVHCRAGVAVLGNTACPSPTMVFSDTHTNTRRSRMPPTPLFFFSDRVGVCGQKESSQLTLPSRCRRRAQTIDQPHTTPPPLATNRACRVPR